MFEMGIRDFDKHILVATNPDFINVSTILLKKTPFSQVALVQLFGNETMVSAFVTDSHADGTFTVFGDQINRAGIQ